MSMQKVDTDRVFKAKNLFLRTGVILLVFLNIASFVRGAEVVFFDVDLPPKSAIKGTITTRKRAVDTSVAVLHHTATQDTSLENIKDYHMLVKGWDTIGYNFLIRESGEVEVGRSLDRLGAHAKGRNHYIGIALTGKDYFTIPQLIALNKLLRELGVEYVEPHYSDYACPGLSLKDFMDTYNKGVR